MIIKRSLVFPILLVVVALAFASVALAETDFDNIRDPDQKYKECLERCERQHEGQSFQERCRDDCQVRRKETEERREQERGGERGREERKRQEEEREREEEEERRREQEKGGGGRGREEQQREEERSREHEKGSGGRGREEQERRREHEKGSGSRGQEERAQEEEERARKQEEQQEEEWREHEKGGRGGRREKQRREKEGDNIIREVTSRDPKYSHEGRQQKEQEGESGQEGEKNPFVFEDKHFRTIIQTQHGRERVLPKFTERSKLFKGIQNYRLLIAEAEPQAFVLPKHYDADTIFFIAQGKGTVSIVRQNKRETFNVKRGDVGALPSGTTLYVINPSSNEKLVVAKLIRPVNTPGRFEYFFGAGGEEPESSFYRAFSTEILEAAFNTGRDKFEGIFGQQRQGEIVKASEEQIKHLSQHEEEGGFWPFGGESKSSIVNIFKQQPIQSNQYGQLYQVDGSKLRQFQDLDVAVSVANISQGSMSTVLYNSRATKIAIVSNGEGYFEMACPHLSKSPEGRQQEQQGRRRGSSPSYQKVSARLRPGVVVVIPAGHPHVVVASENQNLEMVSFAINANNNERFPLAGRANVINQVERTAKELAFGVPAREVEEVFRNQEEDFFFKGPNQKQRRG